MADKKGSLDWLNDDFLRKSKGIFESLTQPEAPKEPETSPVEPEIEFTEPIAPNVSWNAPDTVSMPSVKLEDTQPAAAIDRPVMQIYTGNEQEIEESVWPYVIEPEINGLVIYEYKSVLYGNITEPIWIKLPIFEDWVAVYPLPPEAYNG